MNVRNTVYHRSWNLTFGLKIPFSNLSMAAGLDALFKRPIDDVPCSMFLISDGSDNISLPLVVRGGERKAESGLE